uniref:hypothetical protein n=1 Tax=Ezakiella massiliensis TaxID=1852374 RepID=UPI00094E3799|nr:hypothetical protein [Ezakiella massiliensis]
MNELYGLNNASNKSEVQDKTQVTLEKNRSRLKLVLNVIVLLVMIYHIKNLVQLDDIFANIVDVCESFSFCLAVGIVPLVMMMRGYKLNTFDKILYLAFAALCIITAWIITDKWKEVVSQGVKNMILRISDI